MKPAFTHCALHVSDLEQSIVFYRRFCGLHVVREHGSPPDDRAAWLAEEGRENNFVLVLVEGGKQRKTADGDMTHYGFAVPSTADVDRIAAEGREADCLHWEPQQLPSPVGYLCALRDPDGYIIEFSYGQPLGPGAKNAE
jgi:catechol 2,3-dioxygenase-like lactoylglutathione lyase family enzyme